MSDSVRRDRFLTLAIAFEGGLAILAMGLGRWAEIRPTEFFSPDIKAALIGIAAAFPLFFLFETLCRIPFGPLKKIRDSLVQILGPELALCRWWELLILALVTGFGEELLFRGLFQPWVGLFWSNVAFGLVHFITPLYAVLAGGIGYLLGWLLDESGNLLVPIATHSVYDFLAFLTVANLARQAPPSAAPPIAE